MGVTGLWRLLSEAKEEIRLAECRGKKLAVDLSAWIVECSSVSTGSTDVSKPWLCCRGIFFRTLNLLALGAMLVFVLDGPQPPAVKKKRKKREEFYQISLQYKELLKSMGLPVLECEGEAEKMCAELDRQQLVDGVLTNDGDVLVYGARTVYKGLFTEKKEHLAHKYEMARIREQLGFGQRELVAFALLSGGDFCKGVSLVGIKKFEELIKELKNNSVEDVLDRIHKWNCDSEISMLDNQQKSLCGMTKERHCTRCIHTGNKQDHVKHGCGICHYDVGCKEKMKETSKEHPPCNCPFHQLEQKLKPFEMELKVRSMALKDDPNFPDQAVIDEFLERAPVQEEQTEIKLCMPNFPKVCEILQEKLKYTYAETMSYFVPVIIKMAMHGLLPDLNPKPLNIIKACKHNYEQCFMVRWQRLDLDEFTSAVSSCYDFPVPADFFTSKYPDMVDAFRSTTYRRALPSDEYKKRKAEEDTSQPKMTSYFKVVKQT